MPRKKLIIQEIAVIAEASRGNPVGEALTKSDPIPPSPMTLPERHNMVGRLDLSITELMDEAENIYQTNSNTAGTTDRDPDYITRLSTNEFFFYTKEPLTLKEFEDLQSTIADKAKTLSSGVQLILGSFAVKTEDNKVMNVTPHVSCGETPNIQLIVKNYTSSIDVRYKIPDGLGDTNTLGVLDKTSQTPVAMPQIMINGRATEFTFNNIVPCKTPGGTSFVTAIDICLDHAYGIAKNNFNALASKDPGILQQPVSHVVVSNSININDTKCIGPNVMHVDPYCSLKQCKNGISQEQGPLRKLAFGNGFCRVLEVVKERIEQLDSYVTNNYAYKTSNPSAGRDHKSYTASLDRIKFKKPETTPEFQDFKSKYQAYRGDYLKTQILEDLKNRIQQTSTKEELDDLKKELKTSYEGEVLNTGQGWFTQKTGIKTSSIKALESMIEQQEKYLSSAAPKPST